MDRRGSTETADQHRDERLQKAVDVILESYKGGAPEGLYPAAIACFETLMEISQRSEAIEEFSHRKGMDLKYVVDGANFVISRMHFNAENNYYLTLGLPRNARPEEIRERWKKLMLLYHPDRQAGNEDWVTERAKKVNEAYSVLKDEQKRSTYDRQQAEAAIRQEQGDRHRPSGKARAARTHLRQTEPEEGALRSMRKYFTKVLVAVYVFCIAGVVALIYFQNRAPELEAQLRTAESKAPAAMSHGSAPGGELKKEPHDLSAERRETAFLDDLDRFVRAEPTQGRAAQDQKEKNPHLSRKQAAEKPVSSGSRKLDSGSTAVPLPAKDGSAQQSHHKEPERSAADVSPAQLLRPVVPQPFPQQKKEEAAGKDDRKKEMFARAEVSRAVKDSDESAPPPAEKTEPRPLQEAKAMPASVREENISRSEAEELVRRFVKAYEKGDLDLIMSLFSKSALENGLLRYSDIRNAYRMAFDGKINQYQLRDLQVRPDGPAALVTGFYSINRYSAPEDRWLKFSGRISWRLVREQDNLRIIALNYDK